MPVRLMSLLLSQYEQFVKFGVSGRWKTSRCGVGVKFMFCTCVDDIVARDSMKEDNLLAQCVTTTTLQSIPN